MTTSDETVAAWREAGERGDADAAIACLADGAVLVSPLTARLRFEGREQVGEVLHAALAVISGIRYHTEVGDGPTRALFYRATVGAEPLEEAQLLRLGPDGRIAELTLYGRPLPAVAELLARLGPILLRRSGRPALARAIALAGAPLATMARTGDKHLVPLARPK